MIIWIAIAGAFVLLGPLPALVAWLMLFGRHRERTAASSRLRGTYYDPYADEMLDAEARLLGDPALQRVETRSEDGVRLCADLLPGKGILYELFDQCCLARAQKAGINIDLRHCVSSIYLQLRIYKFSFSEPAS